MTTLLNQLNTNRNTYQIKNLGRVVTGKTPSKDHPEDWGNQIDFITPTDFSGNEKYLPIIKRKISQSGAIRYKNMIVPERSVVVTCIGSDMGKVIITKNKALTNQQINTIVVDQEKFDIDYVYYVLRSLYPTLRSVAEEGGSTMPIITKSTFEQLEFEAPNLTTQNKIAEILSAYDAKIENNNVIVRNLETMAQTIFNEWFVNFRFPGFDKAKFVANGEFEIPDGWEFGSVRSIFEINPLTRAQETVDVPFVEMRDLSELDMTFSFEQKRRPTNGSRFKNHDTLIARITPCLENGKTGYVNCLGEDEIGAGSTEFIVLRPIAPVFREFTYLLARHESFRSFAIGRMVGSSGRQRVSGEDIGRFEFVKPAPVIIQEFHKIIAPMFALIKEYSNENISLKSQRDRLLAKLI